MIHIEKITINDCKDYPGADVLKNGFEFSCSDVNLFVGNQGCGKSTLLNLIRQNNSGIKIDLSEKTLREGVNSYYFDSENDNPRTKDPQMYTTPGGQSVGYGLGNALKSRFMSHGEVLQDLIISPLLKAENCVILLDEPESGLSITNQFKLIEAIRVALKNNCQLFIATHCYPLIKEFDIISLEHYEQMSGSEFIEKTFK